MCLMSYYAETGYSCPWSPDFKDNSIIVLFLHTTHCTGLNIVYNIGYHFVEPGSQFKWGSIHNRVIMGFQWMVCWLLLVHYAHILWGWLEIWSVQMVWQGQSESAPTSARMGVPFSFMPIPVLTKVVSTGDYFFSLPRLLQFFFLELVFLPHAHPSLTHLPTYI